MGQRSVHWARGSGPGYDACLHHASPPSIQDRLRENVAAIRARIEQARARGPHAAKAVELVVVTKSVQPPIFGPLAAAGVRTVGENRVQSAAQRRPLGPDSWTWHGIGHLQRNKARTAIEVFDVFEALDSLRLAGRLDALLAEAGRTWPVYLQINAAEDPAKTGFAPAEALAGLRGVLEMSRLEPRGFMTMAKIGAEEGDLRATFRTLREVRDESLRLGLLEPGSAGLSMGMSDDFEIAVEEGATLVRVGRAVFAGVPIDTDPAAHAGGESTGHGEQP